MLRKKLALIRLGQNLRMRPNPNVENTRMNNRGDQLNRRDDGRFYPISTTPVHRRKTESAARESR